MKNDAARFAWMRRGGAKLPVCLLFAAVVAGSGPALGAEQMVLQKVMKELGRSMELAAVGIASENYEQVEKAALVIHNPPRPATPFGEKMRLLGFLGSNTGKFKAYDDESKGLALALAKTARERNAQGTINAFHKLQTSCLACHREFRKPFAAYFHGPAEPVD